MPIKTGITVTLCVAFLSIAGCTPEPWQQRFDQSCVRMLSYAQDVVDRGKTSKAVWHEFLPGTNDIKADSLSEQGQFLADWRPGFSYDILAANCFPKVDGYGFLNVLVQTPGLGEVTFSIKEKEDGSFYATRMTIWDQRVVE